MPGVMTSGMCDPKRIDFIDLAKGICIILVVIGHCGVPVNFPGLEIVRMPLYFVLSGLFYKDYGSGKAFLIKKTNRILIPFLFFYLIAYLPFYLLKYFKPELLITGAEGILDVFTNRQFFNGPIWFLLALFWCNVYYRVIRKLSGKNIYIILPFVLAGGLAGYLLGRNDIFVPLFMDVGLTALPFFYMGVLLVQTPFLYKNRYDRYNFLWVILLYFISYYISGHYEFRLSLHYNKIEGIATYFLAGTSVLVILFLSKMIRKLPVVSYMGRYSIILLCTHHLFYRPINVLLTKLPDGVDNVYMTAAITLLCCWIAIPLCVKYIPYFVAQKDLIKYEN